ncbi:hypothetical protein ACQKRQ_02105 [Paraburkholderia sp. NPDC080076]|uniref:hypothetical protein n=1 Tax=Paraburkholderia sp. NPDC080076 TaxID=3390605 RepID=UPI003CFF9A6B
MNEDEFTPHSMNGVEGRNGCKLTKRVIVVEDRRGKKAIFDFAKLALRNNIIHALQRSFVAAVGHTAIESQRTAFRSLCLFSECLREAGRQNFIQFPHDVVSIFSTWLDESELGSSAQWHLSLVLRLLRWCSRNIPGIVSPKASLVKPQIRDYKETERKIVDEHLAKKILKGCYVDIEKNEADLERGRRLRAGEYEPETTTSDFNLIAKLLRLDGNYIPNMRVCKSSREGISTKINDVGGLTAVRELLWLSPRTIFPYFLAILTQTSGNSGPVLDLERDCIVPHPLRSDIERLIWDKSRSTHEQHVEFPVGREWSAPNLVRRVTRLNAAMVNDAPAHLRNRTFICLSAKDGRVTTLNKRQAGQYLREFIERHDLPAFDFKDLRGAGARLHHREGKSLLHAQRRLNHAHLSTTTRYTSLADRADDHDEVISRFQGKMIKLSLQSSDKPLSASQQREKVGAAMETVFGFQCRDPLSGIAPGSRPGETCGQFTKCATCPGSIIPLDVPEVIARILAALSALQDAHKRSVKDGWYPRFALVYEPTLQIIVEELVPAIHPLILEEAKKYINPRIIPYLE